MRRFLVLISSILTLAAVLTLPASALASGSYDYGVIHDYCGGDNGWTNFYKAREIASDTASANKLTIDSYAQTKFIGTGHAHWHTAHSWARVSKTFTPDGTYHFLTLARSYAGGGPETISRIVFKLKAWDLGTVVWARTLDSTTC